MRQTHRVPITYTPTHTASKYGPLQGSSQICRRQCTHSGRVITYNSIQQTTFEKLTVSHLVKKPSHMFVFVFTSASLSSPYWGSYIYSIRAKTTSLWYIL